MGSSLLVIYGGEGTFYGFKPARNRFSGLLLLMKLIVTFQKKKWVFVLSYYLYCFIEHPNALGHFVFIFLGFS